jgi:hypothetical protein
MGHHKHKQHHNTFREFKKEREEDVNSSKSKLYNATSTNTSIANASRNPFGHNGLLRMENRNGLIRSANH